MNDSIQLQNSHLTVKINFRGAELSRLYSKVFEREILWDGNPDYWARHAPVLFPFVGKLKDGQYEHNGITYKQGQHGFARDEQFTLIEQSKSHCVLELTASEKTKQLYPFNFALQTTFTLKDNTIRTAYEVKNVDDDEMYFNIGAHPAFNCPMKDNRLEDYQLTLAENEQSSTLLLDSTGLLSDKKSLFLNNDKNINLNEGIFKNDALMFTDLKSNSLTINSEKDDVGVKISWENFPYLGIWKPIDAPFICIEPWYGIADFNTSSGKLSEKFGIIKLGKKENFQASYYIEIQ
jgi:galactose mutarotase-like enzyme